MADNIFKHSWEKYEEEAGERKELRRERKIKKK
jgi:hypothetical protein